MSETIAVDRSINRGHEEFAKQLEARGVTVVAPVRQTIGGLPLLSRADASGRQVVPANYSDPASDRRPAAAAVAAPAATVPDHLDPVKLAAARAVVAAHAVPVALAPGYFYASAFKAEHLSGYSLAEFEGLDFHGSEFPIALAKCRAGGLSQQTVSAMIRSERSK